MFMRLLLSLLFLLLGGGVAVRAQELRASISGRVADPSGSAIPGAQVVVNHVDTNVSHAAVTNEAGRYTVLFLQPGRYRTTVEAAGFKKFVRENVVLGTSERGSLDVQLELGGLTESVTVTAEAPLLNTETASRGLGVSGKQIVDLPAGGRNPFQHAFAQLGIVKASSSWGPFDNIGHSNASNVSINGGLIGQNDAVLDGVSSTMPILKRVAFTPPLESVAELKVQTNNYDAAYGRVGGGVVAMITKSGTNAFHGTLFEFHQNAALNARSWDANFLGSPTLRGNNNNFGFHLEGPVYVPKILDGRNRLFFSLSMDSTRSRGPDLRSAVMPDAAMRAGDFSGNSAVLYDPLTTRQQGSGYVRQTFAASRIPTERINPVSKKVFSFVPLPNIPHRGPAVSNYLYSGGTKSGYNEFLSKVDYRINSNNNMYFSYGRLPQEEFNDILFGGDSPAETSASNPGRRQYFRWVLDWTSTLNASTVLNLRWGMTRYRTTAGNLPADGYDPRQLGMADSIVSQFSTLSFPRFDIGPARYTSVGSSRFRNLGVSENTSYQCNVNRFQGRHQIKIGAEFRVFNENSVAPGYSSGYYLFDKGFTQANPLRGDAVTGDEFATFLLGYPTPTTSRVDYLIDPASQAHYYAFFVQDDFKLHRRVTLNLGMRWDYERPYAERYNRMVRGFAFDQPSPIATRVPSLNLRGGLLFAGSEGESRLSFSPDKNNFQPRIGIAVQLGPKWVMRGGYGLSYLGGGAPQPFTGFSTTTPVLASLEVGMPYANMTNPFPDGVLKPEGSRNGLATLLGQSITFGYLNRDLPYSHQYSFSIERALPWSMVAEAAFSGNETRSAGVSVDLNAIPSDQMGRPDSWYNERVPNPMAGLVPLNTTKNGAMIPRQDLLVRFPQFSSVMMTDIPIGRNHYYSGQFSLRKNYSHGMTLGVSYTISKTLEQLSLLNPQDYNFENPSATALEKRLFAYDVPQKFSILHTWELPFGKGRRLAANPPRLVNTFIAGWLLATNTNIQSGFPVGFPNAPPLAARSAKLPADQISIFNAFDKTLFPRTVPSRYTLRSWPTRFPDVRGYPLKNIDLTLSKKTQLTDRVGIELRGEFYNMANHPWFSRMHQRAMDVSRDFHFGLPDEFRIHPTPPLCQDRSTAFHGVGRRSASALPAWARTGARQRSERPRVPLPKAVVRHLAAPCPALLQFPSVSASAIRLVPAAPRCAAASLRTAAA